MKTGVTVAILIFVAVAMLHLYRIVTGGVFVFGEWTIPMWVSYAGVAMPLAVASLLWKEK